MCVSGGENYVVKGSISINRSFGAEEREQGQGRSKCAAYITVINTTASFSHSPPTNGFWSGTFKSYSALSLSPLPLLSPGRDRDPHGSRIRKCPRFKYMNLHHQEPWHSGKSWGVGLRREQGQWHQMRWNQMMCTATERWKRITEPVKDAHEGCTSGRWETANNQTDSLSSFHSPLPVLHIDPEGSCSFPVPHHLAPRDQQPWLIAVLSNKQPPLTVTEHRAFVFINAVHSDMLVGTAARGGFRVSKENLISEASPFFLFVCQKTNEPSKSVHALSGGRCLPVLSVLACVFQCPSQHTNQQESLTQYSSLSWK